MFSSVSQCLARSFCHYLFVEDLRPLVYVEMSIIAFVLFFSLYDYYNRFFRDYGLRSFLSNNYYKKLYRFVVYSLLQRRVVRDKYTGAMHLLIYGGFGVLLIGTLVRALDYYFYEISGGRNMLENYSYYIYKLIIDLGGLAALIGLLLALIRRSLGLTRDLPNSKEDYAIIITLLVIILTGFALDGILYKLYRGDWAGYYDLSGYLFSYFFRDLDTNQMIQIYRFIWVTHLTIAMISIGVLMYTKLSHIVISSLNIIYSEERLSIETTFKPIRDIEKLVEKGQGIGVIKLRDTSLFQRINYLACVKCARCHNKCPANLSGKLLSPMRIMMKMREAMDEEYWDREVAPVIIEPEAVWSCVTCGACINSCPVLINQVSTIADLRRGMFSTNQFIPDEVISISYNVMRTGNPYGSNPYEREEWIRSLASRQLVYIASENEEYDILYWTGCVISYDPNARIIAENLLEILRRAGLKVAVMLEEACCGEPVRRIGDELGFVEIAKSNYEKITKYRFKRLLVACPHGYTVFTRDYPSIGYSLNKEIIHHSQLLKELIDRGIIKPGELSSTKATYHDPCYLGRWNRIYEEPREVIKSIKGVEFVEMPRNRENSFCCGGGGGHVFFEIKRGVRISRLRAEEAHRTGARILVTACPICNTMLRAEAPDYNLEVIDLAVLLNRSLEKTSRESIST